MPSAARKWLPIVLITAAVVASVVAYAKLPAMVTLPLEGLLPFDVPHTQRPLPRGLAVSLVPALMLLVWAGFRLAPTPAGQRVARRMFRRAPDVVTSPAQFESFAKTYDAIVLGVALLLLGLHAAILAAALQAPAVAVRIVPAVLGASLVLMGNVIPRLRPNWVAGLRSKRVLEDPQLWRLTHRAFGTAFVGAGLLTILVGVLAPRYGLLTGIATLLLSLLVGWVASTRRGGAATPAALVVVGMLCAAAVARAQPGQAPPIRDLPAPTREIDDPFSLILAAREYRPGQLLVSDGVEAQVSLVDFAKGTKAAVGRKGAGPGEYTVAAALFRLAGDTIWIVDGAGAAARIVAFQPDLKPGTTFSLQLFNTQDSTIMQGSMFGDTRGRLYSTAIKFRMGQGGMVVPDSMDLVWFDPRAGLHSNRTLLARVRTPSAGKQDIQNQGGSIKVSTPFPGLVPADAWAVFSDGRVAIVRGANYRVEFILPNGSKPAATTIEYERYKVTEADKQAELDAVRKRVAQQMAIMKKLMPPNVTLDITVTPPPSWPAEFPPLALLSVLPAPNGDLWVRRAVPVKLDRERWDVIDRSGKLVARWRLPGKTTIVAVGTGGIYTDRTDEDDLRYVQWVELPR